MHSTLRFTAFAIFAAACSRGGGGGHEEVGAPSEDLRQGKATVGSNAAKPASSAAEAPAEPCPHAVCASDYFVDASLVGKCAVGEDCSLALTLVATGAYHVNDEYPYKFKADDSPDVTFLGSDAADVHVFSKGAQNWTKQGEKTGTMAVRFRPAPGAPRGQSRQAAIAGIFKLSVCSKDTCRLEQPVVKTTVAVW